MPRTPAFDALNPMRHAMLVGLVCGLLGQGLPTGTTISIKGLANVHRITDQLYTGGVPEGDVGFALLVKLGVRTVISVDGARPEVERAKKVGLRYVHVPIGYDGVDEYKALVLARAVRDLPGPIYLHCHHGKHRAPAAAAVVRLCLDERCSVASAIQQMRKAGTDPHYVGLYAAPKNLRRPTKAALDAVAADFPEVADVSGLAQHMVAIEKHWEHLRAIRQAGWKAPPEHPDLDPPHEALQLQEHYRESARLRRVGKSSQEFQDWLTAAEDAAVELAQALRQVKGGKHNAAKTAEAAFSRSAAACVQCHRRYRDVPQRD